MRQEYLRRERQRRQRRRQAIALVAVMAVVVGVVLLLQTTGSNTSSAKTTTTSTASTTTTTEVKAQAFGSTPCPPADGSAPRTTTFKDSFQKCIDPAKKYTATVKTDAGDITIALDPSKAPSTVNNFVALARTHYFDGIVFHRVIPDFVVQGGDPLGTGQGGPGYRFPDELPQPTDYKAGSVAMANSGPNTNGSQFFIVTSDNGAKTLVSAVQGKASYSLFGQVTAGMDVVQKIEADGSPAGTPKVVHKMTTVTITES